jgi:hypothetical protein
MKVFATIVIFIAALVGLGLLFAFPTMWLVNYLFSSTLLYSVFGTSSLSIWQAWALNILVGSLSTRSAASKD